MNSNTSQKYFIKPSVMAGITAAGAAMYRPGAEVRIPGYGDVPLPIVVAGVTFLAAEISAFINDQVFAHIPQIDILEAPMHTSLTIGVQTAVTAAVENFISPGLVGDLGITELVVFAAIAEVGSTYLCDKWINPAMCSYYN